MWVGKLPEKMFNYFKWCSKPLSRSSHGVQDKSSRNGEREKRYSFFFPGDDITTVIPHHLTWGKSGKSQACDIGTTKREQVDFLAEGGLNVISNARAFSQNWVCLQKTFDWWHTKKGTPGALPGLNAVGTILFKTADAVVAFTTDEMIIMRILSTDWFKIKASEKQAAG